MKRVLIGSIAALAFAAAAMPASADVKTREKGAVKFEGMLGRMVGIFGGKAAREGVISTTVVRGNRKVTINDTTGRIVDLSEEKIYELDMKKKTYEVTTFDELRRRMREASERAERDVRQDDRQDSSEKPEKEVEIEFDVQETGRKKSIAGYETRQVIMTVTVREKGRTLEEGGGMVLTADSWLAPQIPAVKEITDFEMRYWRQLQGPDAAAISAEQMAAAIAMYPMLQKAMERYQKEAGSLDGTPLATTTTIEAVKSKEQLAQDSQSGGSSGGGIGGMLARRVMKKEEAKPRATILTLQHELHEVSTTVAAEELAVPAGFKEKK